MNVAHLGVHTWTDSAELCWGLCRGRFLALRSKPTSFYLYFAPDKRPSVAPRTPANVRSGLKQSNQVRLNQIFVYFCVRVWKYSNVVLGFNVQVPSKSLFSSKKEKKNIKFAVEFTSRKPQASFFNQETRALLWMHSRSNHREALSVLYGYTSTAMQGCSKSRMALCLENVQKKKTKLLFSCFFFFLQLYLKVVFKSRKTNVKLYASICSVILY